VVLFELPDISLFSSHHRLPDGRFPVELSLELVSDAKPTCAAKTVDPAGARVPHGAGVFLSPTFTPEDGQIMADTLLLDSAVTANIDEALTQGKPRTLYLHPWTMQRYTVAVAGASIKFSQMFRRAYSRLLSMFINCCPEKVPEVSGSWTESNLLMTRARSPARSRPTITITTPSGTRRSSGRSSTLRCPSHSSWKPDASSRNASTR
jgi:hypothetical protein